MHKLLSQAPDTCTCLYSATLCNLDAVLTSARRAVLTSAHPRRPAVAMTDKGTEAKL